MRDKETLNVNDYPVATWQTESIIKVGNRYCAQGELTIRGISHQKSGEFNLVSTDYGWNLKGSSELQRLNYDLGIGEFADTDFIPNTVTVHYDIKLKPVD